MELRDSKCDGELSRGPLGYPPERVGNPSAVGISFLVHPADTTHGLHGMFGSGWKGAGVPALIWKCLTAKEWLPVRMPLR